MLGMYLAMIDEPSDKEKFTAIYNEYRNLMFYTANKILNNNILAEDAVQESFIKIAKNIFKISEPICSKTASFIVIIVRNTSLDILRKEKKADTIPFDEDIKVIDEKMPDIEKIITQNGFNGVLEAVQSLDKIYSDVLKLKYVFGYNNAEISELLNITPKNVEMRIFRGKQKLKIKLQEENYATFR